MSYSQVILSRPPLVFGAERHPQLIPDCPVFVRPRDVLCRLSRLRVSGVLGVTAEERVARMLSSGFGYQKRAVLCSEGGGLVFSSEDSRTGCSWL